MNKLKTDISQIIENDRFEVQYINTTHSCNIAIIDKSEDSQSSVIDTNSDRVAELFELNEIEIPSEHKSLFNSGIDSIITRDRNTLFQINAADCGIVMVFDPESDSYSMIHAGAIGAFNKIVKKTIQVWKKEFNTSLKNSIWYLGPCISKSNYDLSESVIWKEILSRQFPDYDPKLFDLREDIKNQIISESIHPNNIEIDARCTFQDDFFSHVESRTQGAKEGRNLFLFGRV